MGSQARTALAAIWLLGQGALVFTAGRRPEHAFGFRMFSESSTLEVALLRHVDAPSGHGSVVVPVAGSAWVARDARGTPHRFDFRDRVREPGLSTFGVTMHASYGSRAQLTRLQAALDDVATHLGDDTETRALEMRVVVRKNGGPPQTFTMTSVATRSIP